MTHPIETPRSGCGVLTQPAPITFHPRGGCQGVRGRIIQALIQKCTVCPRNGVGGPQITPRFVRVGRGIECQDEVHNGATVLPLEESGHPYNPSAVRTSGNTAPKGVA